MKRLTEEDIININKSLDDSWNQGIYKEPFGVESIKDYVIYQRHNSWGYSGGSCWGHEAEYYCNNERREWEVFDKVLKEVCPQITYLQYKEIDKLVTYLEKREGRYYGNSDYYDIWYLPLETLYKYLGI